MGSDGKNHIVAYFHCKNCLAEKPPEVSPQQWSRIQAGATANGIQVWCFRCNMSVVNMDLRGRD